MINAHPDDAYFMAIALRYAKRQLGRTAPNPAVGAIIVKEGQIIGQGSTAKGGRPHAETQALQNAIQDPKGATLYVTLEPCTHQGQTPPCIDSIITSGISRVVIACLDPNPKIYNQAKEKLEAHGIDVSYGILESEALALNQGFFNVIHHKRPLVTLKIATTIDSIIALESGESQWITGEEARAYSHLLRAQHDAILVGSNTANTDNPSLTCRLAGREKDSPSRFILTTNGHIDPSARLAQSASQFPTHILHSVNHQPHPKIATIHYHPCKVDDAIGLDLKNALNIIAECGATRLLVEGGTTLATTLLQARLIDQLVIIRNPSLLGSNHKSAFGTFHITDLKKRYALHHCQHFTLGNDQADIYKIL